MTILRCTSKLLKEIGAPPTDIKEMSSGKPLGSWHANIFRLERRKAILFTNDKTLFSLFVTGIRKHDIVHIDELFRESLFGSLKVMPIDPTKFGEAMDETHNVILGKSNSRSVLGSMNDHIATTIFHVQYDGGYEHIDVDDINRRLNHTPMSAIGYAYPIDKLIEALGAT
jgi:hypothetical protein